MTTTYDISHDTERQRYSLILGGVEAYLTYDRPREGHRHITHTIVPEKLSGRSLGKRLVEAVMHDILLADETVSSSCWFASALIEKSETWKARLA
jgi:uncharacterized protein